VPAIGEKAVEPRLGLRDRIRPGDADDIEAECESVLLQRIFGSGRIAQKSRSA
jgi:hypothetical protein